MSTTPIDARRFCCKGNEFGVAIDDEDINDDEEFNGLALLSSSFSISCSFCGVAKP
jgi:hypothetical protein